MAGKRFSSPKAKARATELGLDASIIAGTGKGGAITLADVEAVLPAAPDGLDTAGRDLWTAITSDIDQDFELDHRELAILERACRQADDVARCEQVVERDGPEATGSAGQPIVSPYLVEARQGRATVSRLLASIKLPEETDLSERSNAGRALAGQRWKNRG